MVRHNFGIQWHTTFHTMPGWLPQWGPSWREALASWHCHRCSCNIPFCGHRKKAGGNVDQYKHNTCIMLFLVIRHTLLNFFPHPRSLSTMVWSDLWPTFQWPRHLSRLARRWWSGAISVWISWRTSCVLATLIYDPQLSKEIGPFPRLDVIGQSLYTIFVSIIQWHTALLPPLQLQRRVECQGHGLDSPWRVALRESSPDTAAITYIYICIYHIYNIYHIYHIYTHDNMLNILYQIILWFRLSQETSEFMLPCRTSMSAALEIRTCLVSSLAGSCGVRFGETNYGDTIGISWG